MQVKKSTLERIQIEKLKDIISIDYEDIFIPDSNGKNKVYPGFFVVFGNNQNLFLTTNDSDFELFARRLREVYLEEQDNIISDGILGPQKIHISDLTKNILLSGELEKVSSFYRAYQNQEAYPKSLFFEEDEVSAVFPIFEYHIRSLMKKFDIVLDTIQISNGVNGTYYLSTMIENKPVILPISFQRDGDQYSMEIGNLLNHSIPVKVDISFHPNSLQVNCSIPEYEYYDYSTYSVEKEYPDVLREIIWKNKCVYYERKHLPKIEEYPVNILSKEEGIDWYLTAWGGFIGCFNKEQSFNEEDKMLERHFYYIHRNVDSYFEREQDSKQYYKKKPNGDYFYPVVFDTMNRKMIGIRSGDYLLLEHSFYDPNKTGFYRDNLSGNHFYTVSSKLNWEDIQDTIFLNKEDGIIENVDLLDQEKLEKKVMEKV